VMIEHFGLEKAIHNLFDNFEKSEKIRTRLDLDFDETSTPRDTELHVFRIIQECISNISRHAAATCCELTIKAKGNRLEIVIEDDGVGLQPQAVDEPNGLGFVSIDERVRTLGGTWEKTEGRLAGLRVCISVPLDDNAHE